MNVKLIRYETAYFMEYNVSKLGASLKAAACTPGMSNACKRNVKVERAHGKIRLILGIESSGLFPEISSVFYTFAT